MPSTSPGWRAPYKTEKRTDQTERVAVFGEQATGMGSVREVDEYRVSPNLVRQLPQGQAIVQVKQPQWAASLDVVVLDHVRTDGIPDYEAEERSPSTVKGINLKSARALCGGVRARACY